MLERTVRTIRQHLERAGMLDGDDLDERPELEDNLSASAVSRQAPPAGYDRRWAEQRLDPSAHHASGGGVQPMDRRRQSSSV